MGGVFISVPSSLEKKDISKRIYNLTNRQQDELAKVLAREGWDLEVSPRLARANDPTSWSSLKYTVKKALQGVPKGSLILVGGLTQLAILISELNMYRLCYVIMVYQQPIGVYEHEKWNPLEIIEIEERAQYVDPRTPKKYSDAPSKEKPAWDMVK